MRMILFLLATMMFIFLFSPVSGQTDKLIYDQLIRTENPRYYHVPVGLCEDYPEETTTPEIMRKDMEFLKAHNIKLLRISFGWDAIETQKDQYNWLFWDDFVKMAVEEYGITLIPYICYTPRWNSTCNTDTLFFWSYPPQDYDHFGTFMKSLVTRFKPWIKTWELWNEPDISIYWKGTVEDFSRFTKIGAKAVKEADPQAKVVLAGLAYNTQFTLQLFRDYGVSPYVDIVNMHNYYETWHRYPVENIVGYVNEMSEIVTLYGNKQSLWMAEVGYSTYRHGSSVSSSYTAFYDYEHTPDYQAVDLFKRLVLVLSTQKIAAMAWYELKDLPQTEEVIGDEYNNRYLGVAYTDYKPKPAARALKFFNQLFAQKNKCIDDLITVNRTIGSESEIHAFENEDGSVLVAGWLKTNLPGKRSTDMSGNVKDTRRESVQVMIPLKLKGKIVQYNQLGESIPFKKTEKYSAGIRIPDFILSGGQITILQLNK